MQALRRKVFVVVTVRRLVPPFILNGEYLFTAGFHQCNRLVSNLLPRDVGELRAELEGDIARGEA